MHPVNTLSYCGDLLRQHDPDRFLVSLRMKPAVRPALWALYAFNYEIAKTREVVTETTIGLMRLQWWRDALARIYAGDAAFENEILPELAQAINAYDLPQGLFGDLLYAREFDLENVLPSHLDGLCRYAGFTNAPLMRLGLRVTSEAEDDAVIDAVAQAYGLTGLLRAVPFHATQRRCYMPEDLMVAQGISAQKLYEFKQGSDFTAVSAAVGRQAQALLEGVHPQSRLLKAHIRLCRLHLGQLRGQGYDVFSSRMALPPPFFHLRFALWPL
ncbi:MAG: squalene/phytoene synthase family protein [Rhodospirillales bacterium]|nr:squalene/phytoene synthase family protein [Rhodospirillales bacterium]MCB9995307.1 squalene/phytoene synthase family protein [Rhodospirillales bacterium]